MDKGGRRGGGYGNHSNYTSASGWSGGGRYNVDNEQRGGWSSQRQQGNHSNNYYGSNQGDDGNGRTQSNSNHSNNYYGSNQGDDGSGRTNNYYGSNQGDDGSGRTQSNSNRNPHREGYSYQYNTNHSNSQRQEVHDDRKPEQINSCARRASSEEYSNSAKRAKTYEDHIAAVVAPTDIEMLTEDQRSYRNEVKALMEYEDSINAIPLQAFCLPVGWDESRKNASNVAIEKVEERLREKEEVEAQRQYNDSDDSDDSYKRDLRGGGKRTTSQLTSDDRTFLGALSSCYTMMIGFDIVALGNSKDTEWCYCPLSTKQQKWRAMHGIQLDADDQCKCSGAFSPIGLMGHLEMIGGVRTYRDPNTRQQTADPMLCKRHYGARQFLMSLYANYNGEGIGHKALFKLNDDNWKKADVAENKRYIKALRLGFVELRKQEEKNKQLEAELKRAEKAKIEFKAISDDRYEQIERLKSERLKFNIPEESSDTALNERDVARYKQMISHYFMSNRKRISLGLSDDDVKKNRPNIKLQADRSKKCSFSLQHFFDDLYKKRNTKTTQTAQTHKLLFGDMNATLTKWLLSEWNVEYDKKEVYAKGKGGREQKKSDTAIDEGGPSRQFKSDVWKQLSALSIPVKGSTEMIAMFDEATSKGVGVNGLELIPITDETLSERIRGLGLEKNAEDIKTRAKEYARAVGRIMLHSFVHGHFVSSAALTPLFVNGETF
eukprot:g9307.t1 g9307   contig36:306427-308909(+)